MDLEPSDSGYNKVSNTTFLNIMIFSTCLANKHGFNCEVCVH